MVDERHSLFGRANPRRRSGMPDWRSNGLPSGMAWASETIKLQDDCVSIYKTYTVGAIRPTAVEAWARRQSDGSDLHELYPPAISVWRDVVTGAADEGNPSMQGALLELPSGTTWECLWRITFSDGKTRDVLFRDLTTTAVHTYSDTDGLVRTHYVRDDGLGSDAAAGTSYATAWATLEKAIESAPSGAVVEMDGGYYVSTANNSTLVADRNSAITIVPRAKRIGDDGVDLGGANPWVMVEPPVRCSPTGSGHPNAGVWTEETLSGPGNFGNTPGTSYKVWKWTYTSGPQVTDPNFITATWRTSRDGAVHALSSHTRIASGLDTAAAFAEWVHTNQRYRYGCWVDSTGDIYVRIPEDTETDTAANSGRDPNTLYLTFADQHTYGIWLKNGANSRVSGLRFVGFDRLEATPTGATIDHCWIEGTRLPFRPLGADQWFAHNMIQTLDLTADTPDHATVDWGHVKLAGIGFDGTAYGSKIGGASEGTLSYATSSWPTIERCTFRGTFNGIGGQGAPNETSRLFGVGLRVRDCVIDRVADDSLEPEQGAMLMKFYRNAISRSISGLSTGPVLGGPIYFYFNTIWKNGGEWIGRTRAGVRSADGKIWLKFSTESYPQATIYAAHNTTYAPDKNTDPDNFVHWAGDSAGGTNPTGNDLHEKPQIYGTFAWVNGRIIDELGDGEGTIEYSVMFTEDDETPSGIKIGGTHYTNANSSLTVEAMRADTGVGATLNIDPADDSTFQVNGSAARAIVAAQLNDPENQDLTLAVDSPYRDWVPPCPVTALKGQSFYNLGHEPL